MHRHLLSLSARRYSVVLFSGALLTILCVISVAQMVYQVRYDTDCMVVSDIGVLVSTLKNIDKVCSIAGFDQDVVTLDFLNVKSFSGVQVGGMRMIYPDQWQGPYVKEIPRLQGIYYQIVHAKEGYFIVPGRGVRIGD